MTAEPPARRRWFHDDYFDLFVWQVESGEVTQFQLCYGLDSSEEALVWLRESGFFHDGTSAQSTGRVHELIARFLTAAPTVPRNIRQAVEARLKDYAAQAQTVPARRRAFRRAT